MSARLAQMARRFAVARSFKHLSGPRTVRLAPDQAGVVLLAKNAEWFLPAFLDHHLSIGAEHILILDNGSDDRTCELARRDRVTVLQSTLPAKKNEADLRSMAAKRVFRGGWVMFANSDEMIELPLAAKLGSVLSYCNQNKFTAVLGQMLDLYAPHPTPNVNYRQAIAETTHYSVSAIEHLPYLGDAIDLSWFFRENHCSDPEVKLLRGGLRKEVFGENPVLSKHTLVRNAGRVQLMTHPHCASRVTVADLTLALRHYKLAGEWVARDRESVQAKAWDHHEDVTRLKEAEKAGFTIAPADPKVWRGVDALVEEGFLYVSPKARSAILGSA